MEGESVDTRVPHASNRVLEEDETDAAGLQPIIHIPVDDRMILSQKNKVFSWPVLCFYPILMLTFPGHHFSNIWKRIL